MAAKLAQVIVKLVKEGNQKGKQQLSFVAKNGKQIFHSESYVNRNDALHAWDIVERAIRRGRFMFDVEYLIPLGKRSYKSCIVQICKVDAGNQKGTLGVRFISTNGKIILFSEGYVSHDDALHAWDLVEDAVLRNDFEIRLR